MAYRNFKNPILCESKMYNVKTYMKHDASTFYYFDFCKEQNKIDCSVSVIFLQIYHCIQGPNMSGHQYDFSHDADDDDDLSKEECEGVLIQCLNK